MSFGIVCYVFPDHPNPFSCHPEYLLIPPKFWESDLIFLMGSDLTQHSAGDAYSTRALLISS